MFSEVTQYQQFGLSHLISLVLPVLIGMIWIRAGLRAESTEKRRRIGIAFAVFILFVRCIRYGMDLRYGRFDIFDLLSLQICHIDLILLTWCLIRPNRILFSFNFMIGIPMGLAVALLPGRVHPVPGIPRAMFFIMSHMMLVVGAVYLAMVEKQKTDLRMYGIFAGGGGLGMVLIYFLNLKLGTNFLYIMEAPAGTVIATLDHRFGWPGYPVVMALLAVSLMFMMYLISFVPGWILQRGSHRHEKVQENGQG